MVESKAHFLDTGHLFAHVQDANYIELPKFMGKTFTDDHGHEHVGVKVPNLTGLPYGKGGFTKFMGLILIAAIVLSLVFGWLASRVKTGKKPRGRIWNLLEFFVTFIRDEIAVPAMGAKDAKRFLPFLLTLFFFILTLNLFGMIPFLGSATGALPVTAARALVTFGVTGGSGIKKMGFAGFLKAQVPSMDLPGPLGMVLVPAIWCIEIFGLFVKHAVLAIRLFANMLAGHLVLAIFMAFIGVASVSGLYYLVTPVGLLASLAFSLLEFGVAFLQAYVFTFLASLFIGAAQHAH
jgi:F-type H+-transporting ATPase subunit a